MMENKMKYEKILIQTGICSIVYGDFNGEKDQELFRCPKKLENTDLRRYVNENNCLLGFGQNSVIQKRKDYYHCIWRSKWSR